MLRAYTLALAFSLASATTAHAVSVGEKAPEFALPGANGKTVKLSDLGGRYVVLEWLNHGCPFVRKHYDSKNMQGLQKAYTQKGVVWLSIISSAPGKQGHSTPEQALADVQKNGAAPTAVLLDPEGKVGKAYGARTTPHMFVIDPKGVVAYAGAIDDVASTDVGDVAGAKNYVRSALDELLAGKAVSAKESTAYGCSVKYP